MASFNYDTATRKAFIQFRDCNRTRRTLRLSGVSKSFAERFHSKVERLNEARCTGGSIDNYMMEYLNELGAVFYSNADYS